MSIIRPMLAQAVTLQDLNKIRYPCIVQIKYDGIRGVVYNGGIYSRSGKSLPNKHVQSFFKALQEEVPEAYGLDGELIVGLANDSHVCMNTTSAIMTQGGKPEFLFYAFDLIRQNTPYYTRRVALSNLIEQLPEQFRSKIVLASEFEAADSDRVQFYMSSFLEQKLEGCILREPSGVYKHGRSTLKQGLLLKYKDIVDCEGIIVGFEQLQRNLNQPTSSELGYTVRSSHKDNKVPDNLLGALIVCSPGWNGTFKVGTGFDIATREMIWNNRGSYIHQPIKFKYLQAGMKDLPRHPVFLGFRKWSDLDKEVNDSLCNVLNTYTQIV